MRMLAEVSAGIDRSFTVYKICQGDGGEWGNDWVMGVIAVDMVNRGLMGSAEYQRLEFSLTRAKKSCSRCQEELRKGAAAKTAEDAREGAVKGPAGNTKADGEKLDSGEEGEVDVVDNGLNPVWLPVEGENMPYPKTGPGKLLKCKGGVLLHGAVCRATTNLRRPDIKPGAWVNPLVQLISVEARRFQMIKGDRVAFDEFADGPSRESWQEFMDEYASFPVQQPSWDWQPSVRSVYELFADHGYRLEREFALMFVDDEPQKVLQHALPCVRNALEVELSHVDARDTVTMGMKEMLSMAGQDPDSTRSITTFVQGKTEDGRFIRLDPAIDRQVVQVKHMTYSTDIDSLVITSHMMHIMGGSLEVDVLPNARNEAPMSKGNHTYVQLLPPRGQAEIDADPGRRSTWWSQTVSVASLPHTRFAKIGPFEIMIVFPRMKHQNPQTKKNTAVIPWEIHSLFLDSVVYPAIRGAEGKERDAYNNYCSAEWRWKAAMSSNFSGKRKTAIVGDVEEFQKAMRIILDELCRNDPERNMFKAFKSFFFVMEAKGIKAMTHFVTGTGGPNPYEQLKKQFPYLDFDALQKRENGQILMDLGMGFHPNRPDDDMEPVVGMWNLEYLIASYGAAGMKKPSIYPSNTMPAYGGCQAEMGRLRGSLVQIVFRSTYNLSYEAVRRIRGGHDSFCEDGDAYQVNHKFKTSIQDYSKMLKGAKLKDHSHGCREELRASGTAIVEILQSSGSLVSLNFCHYPGRLADLESKMKKYCEDDPILWVSSKTFFEFNQRRLLALAAVQRRIAMTRPSNYGLTSTLIMHLIRSVCHAPDVRLPHLQRALTDLSYEVNSERFGIFFLHTLDMETNFIAEIEAEDDAICSAYYDKRVKVVKKKNFTLRAAPQWADTVDFPLGRTPSWPEWVLGMAQDPKRMVRPWSYSAAWGNQFDEITVSLFIRFTREYIGTLRLEVLMAGIPDVDGLEQAVNVWTVAGIQRVIINPMFVPSSSNVLGRKPGAVSKTFVDQVESFFPATGRKTKNVYDMLIKYGYIGRFHQACKNDPGAKNLLQEAFQKIFCDLQCLPVVRPGKQLWKVKDGNILFQVNSAYFRLDGIAPKVQFNKAPQAPRAKASNIEIARTLLQLNGETVPNRLTKKSHGEIDARRQQQKVAAVAKSRSGPAKNARIPPNRSKPKATPLIKKKPTNAEASQHPGADVQARAEESQEEEQQEEAEEPDSEADNEDSYDEEDGFDDDEGFSNGGSSD